ncbi:membrane-spanning 4-domains subfamily A member 8-like [Hippopotamus amphibius kiboko]|uniref:membrane-spanning 4-domains subfamily A member 8-like n=1 Tax=Hippopotamus amphibius kiboko TaxID=575201 RepID=UPI00259614CD|nr:membrane-spanning 4-domains subfamily A member 8-like [Hippopotamus amphibius kiboko]
MELVALLSALTEQCSTKRMSEIAEAETPTPTPSSKLEAAQPTAQLPSEASSSVVTSQEQQPVTVPPPETPRVPWQSPEEPFPQPEILENTHPSREELFFQGHPATLGALQMFIGLLHVSCGTLLAAVPNFVEFPTTYWYPLTSGVLMQVSVGLNLASSLCAGLGVCAFLMELVASGRYAQMPRKILSVLLLVFSILELGIASSCSFVGFQATFCYTWLYLNPTEDVPMATAAPHESPPRQVQQPLVSA